ncbi:Quinolinate synthase A [bioreactor metagenome]|uniref:quinolinate synthase n=1 Tax=bioreactor metagenome TaxID=1076179 RepID=A0A644XN68_9ZZZZ
MPDRNLGNYVSRFLPKKRFIYHTGYCPVHDVISVEDIRNVRSLHPGAPALVHPECSPEVVNLADFTDSTAEIINYAVKSDNKEFIIITEIGVLHRLKELCPEKCFFPVRSDMTCRNMKKTTLSRIMEALEKMQYQIDLNQQLIEKANASLDRMLRL